MGNAARAGRPRGVAGRPRRRGGRSRDRARPRRPRDHAVAQPDRAVPAILAAARPARAGVPCLGGPWREPWRHRQPRRRRGNAGAARGARPAARLPRLRQLQARAGDGEDPRVRARAADGGLGAGAGAGRGRRRGARGDAARGRRQRTARAVGLALLRRDPPVARARPRRREPEAVFRPRHHARGGVRRGRAAVRPAVRAGRGRPLPPRRTGLGGPARRSAHGGVHRRLLRASVEAVGRLVHHVPGPEQARPRGAADRGQRLQLRQGAGRRAEPADLRRCPHAVPRDGARAARAALGRDLRVRLGDVGGARLRGTAQPALRALAGNPRGPGGARASRRAPARRCRQS